MAGRILSGIYRLEELIGGGGFADVYRATDLRDDRVVAVKILHPHLARQRPVMRKFMNEARHGRMLAEPHIVRVQDAAEDAGTYYIVMEYVAGRTLAETLRERRALPPGEVVAMGCQVLLALEAAHRAGIVHRDIKPQNLMLTPSGLLKVMDFGIAKDLASETRTQTGMYFGAPDYMSPEQARGDARIDGRSDLYSLGATLFELLTGRPPFHGETPLRTLDLQQHAVPPKVGEIRRGIPKELEEIIERALKKLPSDRYQTAEEMREALAPLAPAGSFIHVNVHGRPMWIRAQEALAAAASALGGERTRVVGAPIAAATAALGLVAILLTVAPKDVGSETPTVTAAPTIRTAAAAPPTPVGGSAAQPREILEVAIPSPTLGAALGEGCTAGLDTVWGRDWPKTIAILREARVACLDDDTIDERLYGALFNYGDGLVRAGARTEGQTYLEEACALRSSGGGACSVLADPNPTAERRTPTLTSTRTGATPTAREAGAPTVVANVEEPAATQQTRTALPTPRAPTAPAESVPTPPPPQPTARLATTAPTPVPATPVPPPPTAVPFRPTPVPPPPPAPPSAPPVLPQGLSVINTTSRSVALRWTGGDISATEYVVLTIGPSGNRSETRVRADSQPWASITGLVPNTTYQFSVRAVAPGGSSDWSGPITVTTPVEPTPVTVSTIVVIIRGS